MSEERKPWGFPETPEAKCTMNYCDENGCQNRKRTYAPLKSESEDISARAEERYPKHPKSPKWKYENILNEKLREVFIEGYKACLAAQSQSVEESKWIDVNDRLPEVAQIVDLWIVPKDVEKSHRATEVSWSVKHEINKQIKFWIPSPSAPIKKNEI